jgi:tRNA(adenine34) deaminase
MSRASQGPTAGQSSTISTLRRSPTRSVCSNATVPGVWLGKKNVRASLAVHRTHLRFMRQALTLAERAIERGELPIAALVVLDGTILTRAHTTEVAEGRLLVHAELRALEEADRLKPFPGRRRDAVLYTNLEPCLMCLGAAMSFMLGEIYYALESPSDGAVALARGWQRDKANFAGYQVPEIHGGLLRRESRALFVKWMDVHPPGGPVWEWAKSLAEME